MGWFSRFFGNKKGARSAPARIFFRNTLSGQKEVFASLKAGIVTMYSCGPTVYDRAHIGNLRSYIFSDTIARVLTEAGFHVHRVINITDVGHLTDDADQGEDKIELGAKRTGKSVEDIVGEYTRMFIHDLGDLGVDTEKIQFPRATEYIKEQIALAKTLEEKGFAYRIADGLYFDTSKFPGYGKLGGVDKAELKEGARVEVNKEKRNPADFALWKVTPFGLTRLQEWKSPWGTGFPGWHLECSAMTRALLGTEIDIHTGGIDHIPVHHNNEIAQSEASSGRQFVRYWIHGGFLTIEGAKISKSLKNDIYLSDIEVKGIHPLALRYFFLQAHYRSPLSFSWDALEGSAEALLRLWRISKEIAGESKKKSVPSKARDHFIAAMHDDLATPQAIAILWDSLKSEELRPQQKWALLEAADALLGLSLLTPPEPEKGLTEAELPAEVRVLTGRRETARAEKDYSLADKLRREIEECGYHVEDGPDRSVLTKKRE